ncbi:MAG: hypothetical protein K6T87_07360 [Roseiflexus sp.]|uniref:hypothetical protein n=1 Tax=Roseiflexus sp. TaxID=2562120 RepID=UPI0025EF5F00|nr:hypothetical protein [Roseiflexus sp.]MCL6540389.1 hypothetical protein [Roseiflexus sp.]
MMRSVTFWRSLVLPFLSLLASGVMVTAALQHVAFSNASHALLLGLIATALLSGVLMFILPGLVQKLQVCDPSLRHIIIGLIAGGIVVVFFSMPASAPRTLTWRWGAGSQTGAPAPVSSAASWDGVNRSVVELHATNDPSTTPYGVWRAVASLDEAAGVQPGQVDLWLTQPSWAVIDATTGRPPPTADGVDVVIGVQRGQELLMERRVALDPPATPEQGTWHHVTLNLPPGSERLIVEVHMRSMLDYDRVWITEAVVSPMWSAAVDQAALALMVALGVSALVFAGRIPLVVRVAQSISRFFAVYGWLVVGLVCLWLAYLLVWQRGFYLDDWSMGLRARDRQTLEWLPIESEAIPTFPARVLTFIVTPRLIALMWTDEFLVRLLIAGCVGLNAFLLGWLVYRMLHSRLPAIVAGWLFLMPVYTDVTLWAGAVAYVFMTGSTLLMLHVIWSALVVDSPRYIWLLVGSLMLITLMWAEATVGVVSIIPIMGILYRVQRPKVKWRTVAYRMTLGVIVPTIVIVLYSFLVISRSPLATERGEITIDMTLIAQRAYGWLRALYWFTLDPTWGHYFAVSSYKVGLDHVLSSQFGIILLSGISIVLGLTVVSWRSDDQFSKVSEVLLMLALGIVWFLATLYLPYVLASEQIFEIRFLYFPLAGASIATGALVALAISVIRRRSLQRMLLAGCGVLLVILSVCMVGYARLYKVRYEHDMNMFLALGRLAPSEILPERPQFIPVDLDYSLPGKENLLTGLIISAFEASWSARSGLLLVYPDRYNGRYEDIRRYEYITSSRWNPATFSDRVPDVPNSCSTRHIDININVFVQGCPVDSERAIVFTHRNGELALVRTLTLQRSDGTTRIIELPVVSRLAARGSTIIETLVVPVKD